MRRVRPLLAALALAPVAGCDQPEQPPRPAEGRPQPAGRVEQPDLAGDWYVSAVNGAPMTREQITVRFADGLVRGQSGCVFWVWTFRLEGGRLQTGPDPDPQPVCERGLSGFETAFGDAFAAGFETVMPGDGSLRLTGSGGRLLLRRPGSSEPRSTVLVPPVGECPRTSRGEPPAQLVTAATPSGPVRLLRACTAGPIGMARNGGRLVLRDGCLELDHSPSQALIWPGGTRLIHVPSTGELRLANTQGEPVLVGGYIGLAGAGSASSPALAAVPPQCAGSGAFIVAAFHPCPDCATPSRPGVMPLPVPPPPPAPPPPPVPRG